MQHIKLDEEQVALVMSKDQANILRQLLAHIAYNETATPNGGKLGDVHKELAKNYSLYSRADSGFVGELLLKQ